MTHVDLLGKILRNQDSAGLALFKAYEYCQTTGLEAWEVCINPVSLVHYLAPLIDGV